MFFGTNVESSVATVETGVIISAAASSILWNWDLKILLSSVQDSLFTPGYMCTLVEWRLQC